MPTPRPPVGGSEEGPSRRWISFQADTKTGLRPSILSDQGARHGIRQSRTEKRPSGRRGQARYRPGQGGASRQGNLRRHLQCPQGRRGDTARRRRRRSSGPSGASWPRTRRSTWSKGSRVNVVGRVQNNNYDKAPGELVYGLTFTCEEIDYLDSLADATARRQRLQEGAAPTAAPSAPAPSSAGNSRSGSTRRPGKTAAKAGQSADDDIPF